MVTVMGLAWVYINEQKTTISKQDVIIQELTISQQPPILPTKTKTKIKYVEKVVEKVVIKQDTICKDKYTELKKEYDDLRNKTLQCAYNLQFCQESSGIYNKMTTKPEKK